MKTFLTLFATLAISSSVNAAEIKLQNPPINEKAPNFIAINSYGKTIQLSDLKGSPVILEWTNHECPYVARHYNENNMQRIQKMASDAGIIWLSIISSTPGDQGHVSPETANALTDSRGASPTHVLIDALGELGMLYRAKPTPCMYMIDANGILRYTGAIDDIGRSMQFFNASFNTATNYVRSQMDQLIANQSLTINSTTAYGCSVKYNYD